MLDDDLPGRGANTPHGVLPEGIRPGSALDPGALLVAYDRRRREGGSKAIVPAKGAAGTRKARPRAPMIDECPTDEEYLTSDEAYLTSE